MKNNFILSTVFLLFYCFGIHAQVTIAPNMTPQQYVENVLIGGGVQVSNVKFNDLPAYTGNQIGKFNYTGTQIPFSSGLVLSSGGKTGLIGPNNGAGQSTPITGTSLENDPELDGIAGFDTYDVGKLEFDFIPAGNTVSFNYLFSSEEYDEYVCGDVNDVFGFFVTALTAAGGTYNNTNLALVPNTTIPISINTVNNGNVGGNGDEPNCSNLDPNWQANSIYYAGAPGNHFQADGMTVLMNITFTVVCGEPYHFKFAIADGGDDAYDSWVLLKSGSFSSPVVNVSVATVTGDSTVIEGCSSASFVFTRPEGQADTTLSINYTMTGTAVQGTDFNTLPNPVLFPPGQDTVILTLNPIEDGIAESPESVIIKVSIINECGDTIISEGTIYILDAPKASFTATATSGCTPLTVYFGNTSESAFNYRWNFANILQVDTNNLSDESFTFNADGFVQLVAYKNECSDTMTINFDVSKCGCPDPDAFNYDPTAEVNDGSCYYPILSVDVPNVFTPDGNNANELFFLNTVNAKNVELWIFNRWGNIMYEGNGLNPAWDGKINGSLAMDGTYFLKYKVTGPNKQLIEGHGFLQLITK